MTCPLCHPEGENILWQDALCRIIRVADDDNAGYCRVIWTGHVAEMTDLEAAEREHLMRRVYAVEGALRECFSPAKINLASLGNMVPHLHWHVIARFEDDARFPDPVWAPPKRSGAPQPDVDDDTLCRALAQWLGRMDD
ncbi:HIT family protein [Nitrogeniibacter mangrovi]|uniref:HIT family protein n=1 Tax=Nitrogeniibacter mangrovi TaxID=2016596 RepID=A0A6C1B0K6_9RHOO|nr:HIT family protein [Nitrogeniibacter mangrovi]QID16358.1 HIT family protein [Nitrogeniibacter mangrovi]